MLSMFLWSSCHVLSQQFHSSLGMEHNSQIYCSHFASMIHLASGNMVSFFLILDFYPLGFCVLKKRSLGRGCFVFVYQEIPFLLFELYLAYFNHLRLSHKYRSTPQEGAPDIVTKHYFSQKLKKSLDFWSI